MCEWWSNKVSGICHCTWPSSTKPLADAMTTEPCYYTQYHKFTWGVSEWVNLNGSSGWVSLTRSSSSESVSQSVLTHHVIQVWALFTAWVTSKDMDIVLQTKDNIRANIEFEPYTSRFCQGMVHCSTLHHWAGHAQFNMVLPSRFREETIFSFHFQVNNLVIERVQRVRRTNQINILQTLTLPFIHNVNSPSTFQTSPSNGL